MDKTDCIIVGAGSAGCVLANRLSESCKHRVTVLEAGGTDLRLCVQMPLSYGKLFYDPATIWRWPRPLSRSRRKVRMGQVDKC